MSENYNGYNDYEQSYKDSYRDSYKESYRESYEDSYGGKHNPRKEHHEKKDKNCKCECVEGLAHALREFKCEYIYAFEENAVIFGKVKFVKDSSVLVLEDGYKYVDGLGLFGFGKIFISICKLTEFIPLYGGPAALESAINGLKELGKNQII